MKKRFGTLTLVVALVCSLAIPVGAAPMEQTELYQDYLNAADEINVAYGTNISVIPLEDMDPNDMPALEEVRADITALATMMACATTASAPDAEARSEQTSRGLGNNTVTTTVVRPGENTELKFRASVTVVVNHRTDSGTYYIQSLLDPSVVLSSAPSGYAVTGTSSARWQLSSSGRSGIVTRSFQITYGCATAKCIVTASFVHTPANGAVTISPV